MKIDISCENKKCLDLDAFLDTIISFSHLRKKIPFLDLFTNSKQRHLESVLISAAIANKSYSWCGAYYKLVEKNAALIRGFKILHY